MPGAIDFHTHAFPDALAARALSSLHDLTDERACLDGRLSSLLESMDRAGIARSVICCIATRPGQFDSLLQWCGEIASERIIPFMSVHPDDNHIEDKVRHISRAGFKGVKLHPYYQDFVADEDRAMRIYRSLCDEGLILVSHAGYDFAFERDDRACPRRLVGVKEQLPELKLVISHLGGWQAWDAAEQAVVGKDIYMEISYSLQYLQKKKAARMILAHPAEYVIFGTDSPWGDQGDGVRMLRELDLGAERTELILTGNAAKLLGI